MKNTTKKISDIISQEDIPAIMADEEGIITQINDAFHKAYGWKRPQILGKPLITIIPKELHTAHDIGFSRFLNTERPTLLGKPLVLSVVLANGGNLASEHVIYAEKKHGKWTFAATIQPLEHEE
ncbi:PAS domain S-box protein [Legionella lansingensis]|uniref:PAS fold protein n=1 Tax=Legionella lansingensis TaxID=45067 RepID=A0A0W0VTX1_9GAMM|nr:PAS domain-containing protein [Legionella lansingensis]KTD23587.1 PAS fold protein [Legionella lansingensis]SNV52353.1 PAS domain S-box protein [Legionella lansingensis]